MLETQKNRRTRQYLVQAIYQWLLRQQPITDILLQFKNDPPEGILMDQFEEKLLKITQENEITSYIEQAAERSICEIQPIEQAILRLSIYEITCGITPLPVIIKESLWLADRFGSNPTFVHAVLDRVGRTIKG